MIPLEFCEVPPGQIMRKQIPADKTSLVMEFSKKAPADRLASIRAGLGVSSIYSTRNLISPFSHSNITGFAVWPE